MKKLITILQEIEIKPKNKWVYTLCTKEGHFNQMWVIESKDIIKDSKDTNEDGVYEITHKIDDNIYEEYYLEKIQI